MMLALMLSTLFATPTVVEVRVSPTYPQKRTPVRVDPVEFAMVTTGKVDITDWKPAEAEKDGTFRGDAFASGYAMAFVDSPEDQKVFLEARGHAMVYVNGEPRVGDPYSYGYVSLPIRLHKGRNELLFATGRGELVIKFEPIKRDVSVDLRDLTIGDAIPNNAEIGYAGIVVRNATDEPLILQPEPSNPIRRPPPPVPTAIGPMSTRKLAVPTVRRDGKYFAKIKFVQNRAIEVELPVTTRKTGEPYKQTFVSDIDGGVQYYAVNPCKDPTKATALIMSLHGASVEALGQAQAYGQKDWADIVCPTNRRPFGFDWEDVGRKDFAQVLAIARHQFHCEQTKLWHPGQKTLLLTGHSMGGHGTWNIAAQYPNTFDAIAPCAGWESFFSYAGGVKWPETDTVGSILNRASSPSDTLLLKDNFYNVPIYMVHGDADDNVPVTEARRMQKELTGISPEIKLHEEPGAGHWWDKDPAPGADSVDYPPMMEWLRSQACQRSRKTDTWQASCVDPGIKPLVFEPTASTPIVIEQQVEPMKLSQVIVKLDRGNGATISTKNVERFALDTPIPSLRSVLIDGQVVARGYSFELKSEKWRVSKPKSFEPLETLHMSDDGCKLVAVQSVELAQKPEKNTNSSGPFKNIYGDHVRFVYGTAGTSEENAWAMTKARYDAEQFWYRGNSSVPVISDVEWLKMRRQ
ncbi:MAG: prolyl oligopeptidase family serine peptidase, partial [Chthonomonas sp.]|nr:prolyl oligopeptidase family serine peptidase [Chthonomonas sp.]